MLVFDGFKEELHNVEFSATVSHDSFTTRKRKCFGLSSRNESSKSKSGWICDVEVIKLDALTVL